MKTRLTILCPVYNEEETIPLFWERLSPVIETLSDRYAVDLVFLDNASADRTPECIRAVRDVYERTFTLRASRNIGYQSSLSLGLQNVSGGLFVIIDVDCEDPPEMIHTFIAEYEAGHDIVYGERVDREEIYPIKIVRKWFYRVLHAFADDDILLDMAEFSLFTDEVRQAIIQENTSFPFIRSAISRVGFSRKAIPFKREKRIAGRTHYNFFGMAVFAVSGILAASTLLLRLPAYILPFVILVVLAVGWAYVATQAPVFAVLGALVFGTYVCCTVAFTALYVARTYKNALLRPIGFLNNERCIFQPDTAGFRNQQDHARRGR